MGVNDRLTRQEAATYLGVSSKWLQNHRFTGGPPYVVVAGRYYYSRVSLDAWLEARTVRPDEIRPVVEPAPRPRTISPKRARAPRAVDARATRTGADPGHVRSLMQALDPLADGPNLAVVQGGKPA